MNATYLLLSGLIAGADTPPPPAAAAPVVVSTGAGCVGCGPTVAHAPIANNPCNPCGGHATLVDWMKAKAAEPSKPGLIARLRAKNAKPAPAAVAAAHNPCCDPCATGVVSHHSGAIVTPGTVVTPPGTTTPPAGGGGTAIPKDMPKVVPPKDLPKDPPKVGGSDAPAPKTVTPPKSGAIAIPPLPVIPTSGTNSPY